MLFECIREFESRKDIDQHENTSIICVYKVMGEKESLVID